MRKTKFEVGKIYHIFNRGVDKRNIFNNDSDKWRFLQGLFLFNDKHSTNGILQRIERDHKGKLNFNILKKFIDNHNEGREPLVRILADCLMPNHYHLLIEEIVEGGLSRFIQKVGTGYTGFFNKKYNRSGVLFQGPFKVVEINNDIQLQYILAYINVINPGQLAQPDLKETGPKDIDKIMNFARNYSFCTHPDYLEDRDSIIIDKGIYENIFKTGKEYEKYMKEILLSKQCNLANTLFLE